MEKREVLLYIITVFSFIVVICIIFLSISRMPSLSDKKFMSLTGNIVLNLEDNFKVGDNLKGNIIINKDEASYGILSLTKDDKQLITKTFNLNEIPKNKINFGYSINLEDLIDYKFNQTGNYELLFSVLDLDINIKKEFVVK